jgi:hypothetical protein
MEADDTPDAVVPAAVLPGALLSSPAEELLERWRTLDEPGELELGRFDQVMGILRSSSVRDSHETLVDTALLAAPLPPEAGDGLLSLPQPAALQSLLPQSLVAPPLQPQPHAPQLEAC